MITRLSFVCSILILLAIPAYAQKGKTWAEWTQKEAEKVLNDSAWGQTQTEGGAASQQPTQTSAITSTTAARERNATNVRSAATSAESGETKASSPSLHLRVRFMSAKPIREAFVRMLELQGTPAEKVAQIKPFIDYDFSDYVVVTVNMDGENRQKMGAIIQELSKTDLAALKSVTYLERKDGKRIELMEYRAPTTDGLGAKFVFARKLDGAPFLDANSGEVRFVTALGTLVKVNRRFKVADMMYEGKLEY